MRERLRGTGSRKIQSIPTHRSASAGKTRLYFDLRFGGPGRKLPELNRKHRSNEYIGGLFFQEPDLDFEFESSEHSLVSSLPMNYG